MEALRGRGDVDSTHSRPLHEMGWVVSVTPRPRFSPGERTPGTHCTGDWVGPREVPDTEARGKILSPLPGTEPRSPGRPARSQILYWATRLTSYIGMDHIYVVQQEAEIQKVINRYRCSHETWGSVTMVTTLRAGRPVFDFRQGQKRLFLPGKYFHV
jgi:hypothetical protein